MVIPWDLLGTAAVAAAVAAWLAARRAGALGLARGAPADLAVTLALAALVGARLVTVGVDLALSGVLPGWRGIVTLGAGLSTPGAVAGALLAGWWVVRRGRVGEPVWRAAAPAAAAGLALWSLLALVRGDAGGLAAPFPLGWPLPGEATTRVPVALLESAAYGAFALLATRAGRLGALPGPRLAAALAAAVAGVHVLGSLVRPAPPTADGDLDVLFGLLALAPAAVVAAGARPRTTRLAAATASLAGLALITAAAFGGGPADRLEPSPVAANPALEHAITADAASERPPLWGPDDLAAFVAAEDRPVVVNFWASWCPPCHAEAPALARTARAYGDDVAFVGVLVNDEPTRAAEFARRYDLSFPTVLDGGLRRELGAAGLPTTVVLTPDGSVATRVVGGLDARALAAAVDRASGR